MSDNYVAVVVGCGPAGLAVMGNLLEKHGSGKILWVDRHFQGGRISSNYREVSSECGTVYTECIGLTTVFLARPNSNTRVSLILSYAHALEPFRRVINATPTPNAITKLEEFEQGTGCALDYAAEMFLMLTNGILKLDQVRGVTGTVIGADYSKESSLWSTRIEPTHSADSFEVNSRSLILCTGSSPSAFSLCLEDFRYHKIDLDTALSLSLLTAELPDNTTNTVGVIGSSHSAITVLMNLFKVASTTRPNVRVKWFSRRPLVYAVHMDEWILYDNTGLKGLAADFARENLEDDKLLSSPVGKYIEKVDCSQDEQKKYESVLPLCTHIIQAVGFVRDPLPPLTRDGEILEDVIYDHEKGGFSDKEGRILNGLYGAGIAFPELVRDPAGNTEFAVGFWKFMKYLKNVVPHWTTA